jgi:serpin B
MKTSLFLRAIFCSLIPLSLAAESTGESYFEPTSTKNIGNVIEANNDFAFHFYKMNSKDDKNTFFSPYSIYSCFAMVYAGAADITAQEIRQVFHYPDSASHLARLYKEFQEKLLSNTSQNNLLNVANALWVDESFSLLPSFKNLLTDGFGSEVFTLPFSQMPENSRLQINEWVENQTNMKIQNLFPPLSITSMTRLVLANAIHFKGSWERPFSISMTQDKPFYTEQKDTLLVPTMEQKGVFSYYENLFMQAICLPFKDTSFACMIILPKNTISLKGMQKELTQEHFTKWLHAMKKEYLHLAIPKCDLNPISYNLKEVLTKMGMKAAFQQEANFSRIEDSNRLFISDAFHKATFSLDEEGAEAAGATGVVFTLTSSLYPPKEKDFIVNRPFMIMILDMNTQAILFMGDIKNIPGKEE